MVRDKTPPFCGFSSLCGERNQAGAAQRSSPRRAAQRRAAQDSTHASSNAIAAESIRVCTTWTVFAESLPRNQLPTTAEFQLLSAVDHSAILTCLNPKALFYDTTLDPLCLRASLAAALRAYPCLAGRIRYPPAAGPAPDSLFPQHLMKARATVGFGISLCNAGVTFVEADAPGLRLDTHFPLSAMGRCGFRPGNRGVRDVASLPPWFAPMNTPRLLAGHVAPLKAQVTHLGCGGTILALTLSHALLDGHSACMFIGEWAAAYRALAPNPSMPLNPALRASSGGPAIESVQTSAGSHDPRVSRAHHPPPSSSASSGPSAPPPPSHDRHLLLLPAQGRAPPTAQTHRTPTSSASMSGGSSGPGPTASSAVKTGPQVASQGPAGQHQGSYLAPARTEPQPHPPPPVIKPLNSSGRPSAAFSLQLYAVSAATAAEWAAIKQACDPRSPKPEPSSSESHKPPIRAGSPTPAICPPHQDRRHGFRAGSNSSAASAAPSGELTLNKTGYTPNLSSIQLQRLPPAGWVSALGAIGRAARALTKEERTWPGTVSGPLATSVLVIPAHQVKAIKALAAGGTGGHLNSSISTNDAVAALLWTLMCDLRGRPLPGSAPPGSTNAMALAVDLRRNGLAGHLPTNLFANATWCLHVPSSPSPPAGRAVTGQGHLPALQPASLPVPLAASHTSPAQAGAASGQQDMLRAKEQVDGAKAAAGVITLQASSASTPAVPLVYQFVGLSMVQEAAHASASGQAAGGAQQLLLQETAAGWPGSPRAAEPALQQAGMGANLQSGMVTTSTTSSGHDASYAVAASQAQHSLAPSAWVVQRGRQQSLPSLAQATSSIPHPGDLEPHAAHANHPEEQSTISAACASVLSRQASLALNRPSMHGGWPSMASLPPCDTPACTPVSSVAGVPLGVPMTSAPASVTGASGTTLPTATPPNSSAAPLEISTVAVTAPATLTPAGSSAAQLAASTIATAAAPPPSTAAASYTAAKEQAAMTWASITAASITTATAAAAAVTRTRGVPLPRTGSSLSRAQSANAASLVRLGSCRVMGPASRTTSGASMLHAGGPVAEGNEYEFDSCLGTRGSTTGGPLAEGVEHHASLAKHAGGGGAHARGEGGGGVSNNLWTEVRTPLRARSHWQQHHVGSADRERYAVALQRGAAAVRAALQELRAGDTAPTAHTNKHAAAAAAGAAGPQPQDRAHSSAGGNPPHGVQGPSAAQASAGQVGTQQASASGAGADHMSDGSSAWRGAEILELARRMAAAPLSAQLHLAANVMAGQDTILSSWQFPYWSAADFGSGGPVRFQALLHPNPGWSAAVMAAHPSEGGGLYLFLVTPESAVTALEDSPVLMALCPDAAWAQ